MLGIAIINGANQIVQSFGNIAFKLHLQCISGKPQIELPSPSTSIATSGISSASSTSLNRNSVTQGFVKDIKIDDSILLQNILPMVVLYRTKKSIGENINSIISKVKFTFHELDSSHLIVIIAQDSFAESQLKKFTLEVVHLLKCQYGIFIHFIKADLSSIRKSKVKIEKRVHKMIQHCANFGFENDDVLNINSIFSNIENYTELQPIFQQISTEVHKSIGNCRCLFINSGQLIGSTCSHNRDNTPIFELVDPLDLSSILELGQCTSDNNNNATNGKVSLKFQTEQLWLNYPLYNKNQLVNVFTYSISNEIDIICLCSIEQSTLIHTLCELLEILEDLESEEQLKEKVEKIEELVQRTNKLLLEFKINGQQKNVEYHSFVFISSPLRTEKLLRSLWRRLLNELERFSNPQHEPSSSVFPSAGVSRRESIRTRLNRWGSSFSVSSNYSGSTGLFSKIKSPSSFTGSMRVRGDFPVQICALITQFQRQVRSVLNELCVYSQNAAKIEKFERFMDAVRRSIDKTKTWKMQMIMANVMNNAVLGEPLKPVALGLDMLAYKFERLDGPLNLQYIPAKYKEVFSYIKNTEKFEEISVIRLKDGELFLQITGVKPKKPDQNGILKLMPPIKVPPKKQLEELSASELPIKISVLFSSSMHLKLAMKQTDKLTRILNLKMKVVYKLFK